MSVLYEIVKSTECSIYKGAAGDLLLDTNRKIVGMVGA